MATGNRSGAQTRMRDRKPIGKSLAKRSKDGHNYSGRGIQREKKRSALKNTRIDVRRGGRVSETGEKSWEPKSETPSGRFLTAKSSRQEAILHMGSELAPTTHLSTGSGSESDSALTETMNVINLSIPNLRVIDFWMVCEHGPHRQSVLRAPCAHAVGRPCRR